MFVNSKSQGEKAVKFVIAKFAEYDIDVALPMSDNLPFDLIAIKDGKLLKVQVKSGSREITNNSVSFNLRTSNWWKKTYKKYSAKDTDIVACYDIVDHELYLLGPEKFVDKNCILIRKKESQNGQKKNCNFAKDYAISGDLIQRFFPL